MTRSNLIDHLCQTCKLPRGRTEQIVGAVFDSIEGALKRGERVEIRGFGSFEVRHYDEYLGRNPRTGTTTTVKAKKLPFFKVGRELRERVNPTFGGAAAQGVGNRAVASESDSQTTPAPVPRTEVVLGAS